MIDEKFKKYYLDPRKDIAQIIPADAKRVLDIGCGGGILARELKKRGDIYVAGVETNAEAARIARENLDDITEDDIENINLPYEKGYFDCIVMADVLEHLKNPWAMLEDLKRFLNEKGLMIVSIPNARHYSVSIKLLFGRMEYQEDGLLDMRHFHLFTLQSIKKIFADTGYNIVNIKHQIKEGWKIRLLNIISFNMFKAFITFRYIITATKTR